MPSVVEISCPECGKVLKVPEKILGKKIKCKDCDHAFVAKDPSEEVKKPTKPGVKPSKPGGAAVKPKKEEPKPEEKPAEAPAPYKFQDDDDDEGAKPNPLGLVAEEDVARCPFCAKELDPPDAKVCLHCGFNNETRVRAESKKVWAPDTSDYLNHLGPGIVALVLFIGLIVLDIICLVNMREWMTGTFLQKEEKDAQGEIAFYVKPGAFIAMIWAATVLPVIGTARFAIKRLFIENQPVEKVKK
jgi:DNA-directed RNA polymerase subunit M/transcription elongation factor TFIIS